MTVLILERVPVVLRGELSRWMIEPRAGVFVGRVSAMVRERLWILAQEKSKGGAGMLLHSSPNEQGFTAQAFGDTNRTLEDWEGLTLVRVPKDNEKTSKAKASADRRAGKEAAQAESPAASD